MQNKAESKTKLPQYSSLKQFQSVQEPSKKLTKQPQPKSNKKIKQNKSTNPSHSKGKPSSKPTKNNQNFNSINIAANDPSKIKSMHHEPENLKKQNRHEDKLKRNSSQKLIKTKSMTKLHLKSERKAVSPSPLCIRQTHHPQEQKSKISKNATSRTEREKKPSQKSKQESQELKKSSSRPVLMQKPQTTERSNRNRVSIKTEMSSKTHSVIKQEVKSKKPVKTKQKKVGSKQIKSERNKPFKMPKPGKMKLEQIVQRSILYSEVSFQQYNHGENPCESAFVSNDKYFLPYPDLKTVKTQGCQIQNRSHYSISLTKPEMIKAAIKIQKVFRGYITRKYIDQAKYIISKVKIIQNWWRRILHGRKEKLNQKIVSSSNSLITIKDFNDTFKTDKHKIFSESKENTLSNHKINFKEFMKNILEENQSERCSNSPSLEKEQHSIDASKNLSRDNYVELKLQDEIKSERKFNFNSPKNLNSPNSARTPTNCMFNMKDLFGNGSSSNQKQKFKQLMQSPRIASPQQLKNTPQKVNQQPNFKEPIAMDNNNQAIEPFQTNFAAIEEFCLITVNYFRDKPHEMQQFISKLEALKQFRTNLILKTWNSRTICFDQIDELDETLPADYEYLQAFQKPILFQKHVRQDIVRFPEIQIDLLGKRFNLESKVSGPIHRAFLQFIFDALQQAFYQQHRSTILTYGKSLNRYIFENEQQLFENYFSSALGELFKWGQVLCGLLADLPAEQEFLRQQRLDVFLKRFQPWDLGLSHKVAIKIQISEKLVLQLLEQMEMDLLRLI